MTDFATRAHSLVRRIESDRSDPGLAEELDALRALWRSLPVGERAQVADAARALADAQAGPAPPAAAPPPAKRLDDDDAAARRALSGLDRIDVDAPAERRYHGPRDPDALLAHFGL